MSTGGAETSESLGLTGELPSVGGQLETVSCKIRRKQVNTVTWGNLND